jgi:hypothetical protein
VYAMYVLTIFLKLFLYIVKDLISHPNTNYKIIMLKECFIAFNCKDNIVLLLCIQSTKRL